MKKIDCKWLVDARRQFMEVLSDFPREVPALRAAIEQGRIDGSSFMGECGCVIGTIAKARGCVPYDLKMCFPSWAAQMQHFFYTVRPGDTPENSEYASVAVQWIDEWSQ